MYIVYHSEGGHTKALAEAIAMGAQGLADWEVVLWSVDEADPAEIVQADAILWGSGGHFGGMSAPLKAFIEKMGMLWLQGSLVGKIGAAFTTTSTTHGGLEETLRSMITPMLHLGMIVVGLPMVAKGNALYGSYYGVGITCPIDPFKPQEKRVTLSEHEMLLGRELGRYVAHVTEDLIRGRKLRLETAAK